MDVWTTDGKECLSGPVAVEGWAQAKWLVLKNKD